MIPASQPVQFPALSLLCSLLLLLTGPESRSEDQDAPPRNYSIPLLDLSDQPSFHTIVALASMWRVHEQSGKPTSTWRGIFHDYNFDNFTIDLTFKRVGNEWKTTFAKDESPPFFSLRSLQRRPKALWLIEFA